MFEWLSKFERIFVTGPQRSGTRICGKMIAHDLGCQFIDETQINMDSLYNFSALLELKQKSVIQCPTLCRYIHFFASKDNAIVFMRRNVNDIEKSQKRIKWSREWLELIRYDRVSGSISQTKYDFWDKFQKKQTQNVFEIEYDSLKTHPLWIKVNERRDFSPMQTEKISSIRVIQKGANIQRSPEVEVFFNSDRNKGILANKEGSFFLLNSTSLQIWKMCNGTRSEKEIFDQLTRYFPKTSKKTLKKDFTKLIEDLYKNNFIFLIPNDNVFFQ